MPSQAPKSKQDIIKGITTQDQLVEAVSFALTRSADRQVYVETDMRAIYNPTRSNFSITAGEVEILGLPTTPKSSLTER